MIEAIMYFGMGFLAATAFALSLIPLVYNRAVRLTETRLRGAHVQGKDNQLQAKSEAP